MSLAFSLSPLNEYYVLYILKLYLFSIYFIYKVFEGTDAAVSILSCGFITSVFFCSINAVLSDLWCKKQLQNG